MIRKGKLNFNKIVESHSIISVLLCLFVLTSSLLAQVHPDIGQLNISNFSPKEYRAHPQNWAITQDYNGLMYFGNKEGVLIYDGMSWELVPTSNESTVRSLDVSPMGKVFVGAVNDFGFLSADENGKLFFTSLPEKFNLETNDIGDIYHVHAFHEGVYFMTNRQLFFYDGSSLKMWDSESAFQSCYKINNQLIINQLSTGICVLKGDSITPIANANDFRQMRLYDIIRYSERDILVLTERHGIYSFFKHEVSGEHNEAYRTRINTEIQNFNPFNGIILKPDVLSIGTWGHGLLLVDSEGDIIQQVNSDAGMIDDVITEQFIDREKNLWLTTSNGISKISMIDGIVEYGDRVNVNETVEEIAELNHSIFLATNTGLYGWKQKGKSGTFSKVAGISTECWDILPFESEGRNSLLVAGNNSVYQVWEDMSVDILLSCLPWTFHQLESDPNTIFIGLDDGLMCIRYIDGQWHVQDKVAGIKETIYRISESNKNELWLGTMENGIIRLFLEENKTLSSFRFEIKRFSSKESLPEGGVFSETYKDLPIFGTANGIYRYNQVEKTFSEDLSFKEALGVKNFVVHRLSEDTKGRLWMVGYQEEEFYIGYFNDSENGLTWNSQHLLPYAKEVFHAIYHQDDATWLGGPSGLLKYNPSNENSIDVDYPTIIRSVYLDKDSLSFAGHDITLNYGDSMVTQKSLVKIPYESNSISFSYASQYYKHGAQNLYSHKLVGFDQKWSDWSAENKSIYTNLYEGDYTFQVKSKNAFGVESEMATYNFTIQSPWFRSWWAYLVYGIVAISIVYCIIILYTRRLKMIIKSKTAEVVEQKEEVENQKQLLEVKNADITSSINYAKRLQRALLPDNDLLEKYLKDSFILYKPKDIVSGDFYWMEHVNGVPGQDYTLFAAVDCTGHGVPGAFVSVVGNGGLNRAVNEYGLKEPAKILDKLNEIVVDTLSKGESELRDGMDISLCRFDFKNMELQFAGANNSAYLVRKNISTMDIGLNGSGKFYKDDMVEIKANKQPIGYYEFTQEFKNNVVKLQKGDVIYLFSDGYPDQFGGPRGKKYNYPRFKEFLVSISEKPMNEQKELIEEEFNSWRGEGDQIDDIVVAGIRVS